MAAADSRPFTLFAFPDQVEMGRRIARRMEWPFHQIQVRTFPDGESLVRVDTRGFRGHGVLLCSLDHPNRRLIECILAAETLRAHRARSITLVAPYLGYMRQDIEFHPGEAVSQHIVGQLLGKYVDRLYTVDAHLHRTPEIEPVVGIPAENLTAALEIARQVKTLKQPVLVGPDAESEQWVRQVAEAAGCPSTVGRKTRMGDRDVRFELADPSALPGATAVIVDDIVSTGHTAIEAAQAIAAQGPREIQLFAVHGIFAEDAEAKLREAGVSRIVSSNTIPHPTNGIDVAGVITEALRRLH